MSIEPDRDQFFQYATFGVLGLTLVVCLCYALIFINPRANVIAALQPPTSTVAVQALQFPATWTPTATRTATRTFTPEPTSTATPIPSKTPLPTWTPVPRRIAPPPPPAPKPGAATTFVAVKREKYPNCGTWYVQGTVWAKGEGSGLVPGTLVRVWWNGGEYKTVSAGSFGKNSDGYWEVLFPKNSEGSGQIGIVGSNGAGLSPRYDFNLTRSCKSDSDINEWIVDFAYAK